MTHMQLIEMLYRHREEIHRVYSAKSTLQGSDELVKSTLLIQVADAYRLNQNYITFVDAILDRVDYGMVFEDYEKENAKLILLRKKYLQHKKPYYKKQIINLIDTIYLRLFYRDNHIRLLLKKLEHDVSLEIEIIIEEANTILDDISRLIDANDQIYTTFAELKTIDEEIRVRLTKLDIDLYRFSSNIETYIAQLQRFIIQTKEKRRQNRLFMQVASTILHEKDADLEDYLRSEGLRGLYTIEFTRRKKIHPLPSFRDASMLKKTLKTLQLSHPKPMRANAHLQEPPPQKLSIVEIDAVIADLQRDQPDDIYAYLVEQSDRFDHPDDAFKIYLHLLAYDVRFSDRFNAHGIREVAWQGQGDRSSSHP